VLLRPIAFCATVFVCVASIAAAQTPQLTVHEALHGGQCSIRIDIAPADSSPSSQVELDLNGMWIGRQPATARDHVNFLLRAPLQATDVVRARLVNIQTADAAWPFRFDVAAGTGPTECKAPSKVQADDERDPFVASIYVGGAVDNFAPAEVGGYTPQNDGYINTTAGGASKVRGIVGVDFEFRAIGSPDDQVQLWITGETLHGVRSGDVDCRDPKDRPPICNAIAGDFNVDPQAAFLFALAHASSLEAYIAPRLELKTLQMGSIAPAKFYVTMRLGINMLDDNAHEAFDAFHLGAGLMTIKGALEGSSLEVGWGKSDMFVVEPGASKWRRLKFDGLLSFPIVSGKVPYIGAIFGDKTRGFIQMYADFDPTGKSADSVQTFFGLDFNLNGFFKW
jgi:hypothetical protein